MMRSSAPHGPHYHRATAPPSPLGVTATGGRLARLPRAARALVVSGSVACAVLALAIPSSHAQDIGGVTDVGWWSSRLGATAKEGDGIEVALGAADAPQSVAAVHVVVPDGEGEVLLVLDELGGTSTDRAAVELCRTTEGWVPANPGPVADQPTIDCADAPPQLGRDATALQWTGSISELLVGASAGDTVGIALVPLGVPAAAGVPVTTPFQLDLGKATLRLLDTGSPTTAPPTTSPGSDPGFTVPDVGEPGYTPPDLGGGGFDTGPLPEVPTTAPPGPATTVDDQSDDFVALGPVAGTEGPGRPWWRLALLTPISLVGGYGAAFGRRNLRERLATV